MPKLARLSCPVMLFVGLSGCAHDQAVREANLQRQPTPLTASYLLEAGESPVQLVNGQAEVPAAPGSAAVVRTTVWGEPTMADLSGDGRDDATLILIQERGGSGTFYYLAIAVHHDDDFRGVDSVLLGDRIVPQRIAVGDNRVTVHYLDREGGEAMSTPASHPRVRKFRYDSVAEKLAAVAENFEGEADPARMNLRMKTWVWQRTKYNNDTVETPVTPDAFTIRFIGDQRVRITTDCNNTQGGYETDGQRLSFVMPMGTFRHCEDPQERLFARDLDRVNGYLFSRRGELILELKYDTGSMIFR